jgi:excisionase family DNA binding protein
MTTSVSSTDRRQRTLLTPEEVAQLLRVTPRTVRRWGAEGTLERIRLGGRLTRYRADDVQRLISNDVAPAGGGRDGKASDAGARRTA